MTNFTKPADIERRVFLKKLGLGIGAGAIGIFNAENALSSELMDRFWKKVFSWKKTPFEIQKAKIGDNLEFILSLKNPQRRELKKEKLTIETSMYPYSNVFEWALKTGNPKKVPHFTHYQNAVDLFMENTPIRPCPMFLIYPPRVEVGSFKQKSFSVNSKIADFNKLRWQDPSLRFIMEATKKGLKKIFTVKGGLVGEEFYKKMFEFGGEDVSAKELAQEIIEQTGERLFWRKLDFFLDNKPIETARYFSYELSTSQFEKETDKAYIVIHRPSIGIAGSEWGFARLEKTLIFEGELEKTQPIEFYNFDFSEELKQNNDVNLSKYIHNRIKTMARKLDIGTMLKAIDLKYNNLLPPMDRVSFANLNTFVMERKGQSGRRRKNFSFDQLIVKFEDMETARSLEEKTVYKIDPSKKVLGLIDLLHGEYLSRFIVMDFYGEISHRDYSLADYYHQEIGRYIKEKKMRFPQQEKMSSENRKFLEDLFHIKF